MEALPFILNRTLKSEPKPSVSACRSLPIDQPAPRLRSLDRSGVITIRISDLIGPDHRARKIWQLVREKRDVALLLAEIKAVEGQPRRAATDPELLIALWMYAATKLQNHIRGVAPLLSGQTGRSAPRARFFKPGATKTLKMLQRLFVIRSRKSW